MKNNLVIVAGLRVRSNDNGLYSLNDIHRASGGDIKNTPSRWLRLKKTKDLIESVKKRGVRENLTTQKWVLGIETINGGHYAGVYAHELLVVSYAGWIDSDFQIEVNYTFLETIKERAKALELENKKLTDFKDDIYRRESVSKLLTKDYSQFDKDVIKSIKLLISTFRHEKEVRFRDLVFSSLYGRPKVFTEAWAYMERNLVECSNSTNDRDKQMFRLKY